MYVHVCTYPCICTVLYVHTFGQFGLTVQKSVGFSESERSQINCPVESGLKEIRNSHYSMPNCSFVLYEREYEYTLECARVGYFSSDAKGSQKITVALVT